MACLNRTLGRVVWPAEALCIVTTRQVHMAQESNLMQPGKGLQSRGQAVGKGMHHQQHLRNE